MSERQAWRPPVAPKPTSAALRASGIAARDASPALRGATAAFGPPSRTSTNNQATSAGAAVAAAVAGRARAPVQKNGNGHQMSSSPVRGRSQLSLDLEHAARTLEEAAKREHQGLPPLNRTTSAIAARAASTNASPSRKPQEHVPHRLSPHSAISRSRDPSTSARDVSESDVDAALLGATLPLSPGPVQAIRSPLSNESGRIDFSRLPSFSQAAPINQAAKPLPSNGSTSAARTASQGAQRRAHTFVMNDPIPRVTPLPRRESSPRRPLPSNNQLDETLNRTAASAAPIAIKPPRDRQREHNNSTHESYLSRSSPKTTLPVPRTQHFRTSPRIAPTSQYTSPRNGNAGMDVNSLANAMVSASIASSRISSRAPSPSRKKAPPVPRRRSRSLHELEPKRKPENPPLKPIIVRPMKQTLRKQHSDEDGDDKRGRKHRLRKHPNVHHEGDRKRWRDKLTFKERKRYEGLWAANRGVLHDFETVDNGSTGVPTEDLVLDVVVRDIWERSRLPRDVLEEVWDLVSETGDHSLTREQFVVGLWLIDQRLRGRKLPVKVSMSVWSSVRHTEGVKIRNKPL